MLLVLLFADQHIRRNKTGLLNCTCSHLHILSTAHILSHNDLLLCIIVRIPTFCVTLANTISKLPEDSAEAPKHVGALTY